MKAESPNKGKRKATKKPPREIRVDMRDVKELLHDAIVLKRRGWPPREIRVDMRDVKDFQYDYVMIRWRGPWPERSTRLRRSRRVRNRERPGPQ